MIMILLMTFVAGMVLKNKVLELTSKVWRAIKAKISPSKPSSVQPSSVVLPPTPTTPPEA